MLKPESSPFKRASVEIYTRSLYAIYQSDYPPIDRNPPIFFNITIEPNSIDRELM